MPLEAAEKTRPIVLVTGASHGIGAATARLFAAEGFDVCVNYRSDEAAAAEVVRACEELGAKAVAARGDVASPEEVKQVFQTCDSALGRLSCLSLIHI